MMSAAPVPPADIDELEEATRALGFTMRSDPLTLDLLRALAATKVAGRLLELGTGTGISAAWICDGMDARSHLITVDHNERHIALARRFFDSDPRVCCTLMDAGQFLRTQQRPFDFIFADTEIGKYRYLDETLQLLAPGGIYVVDHMLPQPAWDDEHRARAVRLASQLVQRADLHTTRLNWSTGLILAVKKC